MLTDRRIRELRLELTRYEVNGIDDPSDVAEQLEEVLDAYEELLRKHVDNLREQSAKALGLTE